MKDLKKLKKLVALVSIAFALCVNLGIYHHQKVKPIGGKNHGYKANSFFRTGLDVVRQGLNKQWKDDIQLWQDILRRFLPWVKMNYLNST